MIDGRFSIVPAAYVLLLRDGHVLLQLRRNTGFMDEHWAAAAAGHVEFGESAAAAARREAREEIGLADLDLEFLTTMQRSISDLPIDQRVDFFFTSHRWSGEPRTMEPDKSGDLRWFPLDALPDPVVPHERVVLEALRTGTAQPFTTYGFQEDQ